MEFEAGAGPRFALDLGGMCAGAVWLPSPNHDERPSDATIDLVVIHAISLPPGEFGGPHVTDLFLNRLDSQGHPYFREIEGLKVSSHFFIRRDGDLIQYVPCELRAWHAGASQWKGRERCNDFSVGIELEGTDDVPFENPQYATLNDLIAALDTRYGTLEIAGHSDVSPGRKTDPGPHFDWNRVRPRN